MQFPAVDSNYSTDYSFLSRSTLWY